MQSGELGVLSRASLSPRSELPRWAAGQQTACSVLGDKCALGI